MNDRDTICVTVFALARLAESRDPETGDHLERVRNYCLLLARRMGRMKKYRDVINGRFVELLYETSPLHDIGKVGIPDAILLKPGALTSEEFEVMKRHTLIGAETLEAAIVKFPGARFLNMARDIAMHHHERFDGGGYPMGLSGEEIPLSARIVALADVYDALTSKRVYKSAVSHARTRAIILQAAGKQFDPDVVEAFLDCEERFKTIRMRIPREGKRAIERPWVKGIRVEDRVEMRGRAKMVA